MHAVLIALLQWLAGIAFLAIFALCLAGPEARRFWLLAPLRLLALGLLTGVLHLVRPLIWLIDQLRDRTGDAEDRAAGVLGRHEELPANDSGRCPGCGKSIWYPNPSCRVKHLADPEEN